MDKPLYPCKPIGSIEVLAKTLGIHTSKLQSISKKIEESYTPHTLKPNSSTGKVRSVFDPKFELKKLQKRINSRIFENIKFPEYLQGGLKATASCKRDYVENAEIHGRSKTLINLDVKDFYPNIKVDTVRDIFKNFFRFSDDVVDILTVITTYRGCLPQGGCTSSYLANLVFYNNEYRLFSSLRGRGLRYTRLLDDITISSKTAIDNKVREKAIKDVAAMLKKKNLRLKSSKTKITDRTEMHKDFEVTGLCVRSRLPNIPKKERKYIRQLVFNCEKIGRNDKTSKEYHSLWNKTSGLVTRLGRLGNTQASDYRSRLSEVLPEYDEYEEAKLVKRSNAALKVPQSEHLKWGVIKRYNIIIYHLGILTRTKALLARNLRNKLKEHYSLVPSVKDFWEK
ncbi:reverse transcriptase family protein [Pseudoalteromonas sp. AS84]|uniref:reverse transcriptase family protein n=1 Tax=Pseudoalteromonas sp. AS84 TaxID=3135778 RepID=UPI00316BBD8F